MAILGGLDVHRQQITFDYVDTETGQIGRGQIRPATRLRLRGWLSQVSGQEGAFALEATTGWRFVVEELQRVGLQAHLAEPAETRARRSRRKHAKTDRQDAAFLRLLLQQQRVPESWIPPDHLQELRTRVRLRKALVDERRIWQQRMQAQLFHHGLPAHANLLTRERRAGLQQLELPAAPRQVIDVALHMIHQVDQQLEPLQAQLDHFAHHHPGCQALMRHYGIGVLTSVAIVAELGDARRFSSSRQAIRYAGLDITVWESDAKRSPGHLSHQGPPVLRWALHEAAQQARRVGSPDHEYFLKLKARVGHGPASLAVARKLLRRAYHTLRALGDQALAPAA